MGAMYAWSLSLIIILGTLDNPQAVDAPRLREMLYDRQHRRNQSQAAILLLQSTSADAEQIIRDGLRQTDSPETFSALAAAIRLNRDNRFSDELLAALTSGQPVVRQAAGQTLADIADAGVVQRLQTLVEDARTEPGVRIAAINSLGRSGQRAVGVHLLDLLLSEDDAIRQAAADALTDLTDQTYGQDVIRWRAWWQSHKNDSNERWLQDRLAYQAVRARRLEGELDRTRTQLVRLEQQLYSRLPAGDRLGHVQTLAEADDPVIRNLAVGWSVELFPGADAVGQRVLADLLLHLSLDSNSEIQRAAVLALGRVNDARVFDRLCALLEHSPSAIRAAAARALAQQARGPGQAVLARQKKIVPALQRALDDPALEVVIEAAESLGTLGVPEAGPVLTVLLKHPSKPARQAAALALERVADLSLLDGLLAALDDPAVTIRFSLVGAIAHAVGDGHALGEVERLRLLGRLEGLLLRDADPGVRSRAATALGECGTLATLPTLWRRVLTAEDNRVQEKAFAAMIEIIARSNSVDLVKEWDNNFSDGKQGERRLIFLGEVYSRWQKKEEAKAYAGPVGELLVRTQLEQRKWAPAFPLVRDLLTSGGTDADVERRLRWLLTIGEQALRDGSRPDALRAVQEAQPYLAKHNTLAIGFEKLERASK